MLLKSFHLLDCVLCSILHFCQDLVNNGALVAIANKFNETPLDKANPGIGKMLKGETNVLKQLVEIIPLSNFKIGISDFQT